MTMALRADIFEKCIKMGEKRPIDLVYLSSQTMGDAVLEAEILTMFARQLPGYLKALCEAGDSMDIQRSAHTLKGAAHSIGAFELANLASQVETSHHIDTGALTAEVASILSFIDTLR